MGAGESPAAVRHQGRRLSMLSAENAGGIFICSELVRLLAPCHCRFDFWGIFTFDSTQWNPQISGSAHETTRIPWCLSLQHPYLYA
jgi:hypothetical protein